MQRLRTTLCQSAIALVFVLALQGCSRTPPHVQGYIEGRYTYMATPVSGVLKELFVERGSMVKRGDMLFALEEQPEIDAYHAAEENLKQSVASRDAIIANLAYAKIMYKRYKVLVPKNAIQQSQLDNAESIFLATQSQLVQANANIAASNASLLQARWTKEQKAVTAPVNAVVFDTYYRLGEYTEANQAVLSLLAPADIKAIFYVNERDLGKLRLGKKVVVACDGCSRSYTGRTSFISPSAEYTPPVIFSDQTNDKLIYRIEAEFGPEEAIHLHPGQPVRVSYAHDG